MINIVNFIVSEKNIFGTSLTVLSKINMASNSIKNVYYCNFAGMNFESFV